MNALSRTLTVCRWASVFTSLWPASCNEIHRHTGRGATYDDSRGASAHGISRSLTFRRVATFENWHSLSVSSVTNVTRMAFSSLIRGLKPHGYHHFSLREKTRRH